jgi:tetratricopeptide (TPR) repeat protein
MYYAMHGDFAKAREILLSLNNNSEKPFLYWYTLAETELLLGNNQAALSSINKAADMPVLSFDQVTQANSTFSRIGEVQAQIDFLESQISRFSVNSDFTLQLADLYLNNKQANKAEKLLNTMSVKSGRFYLLRANASLSQGALEKANEDFTTAFKEYKSENTALAYADFLNKSDQRTRAINVLNDFYTEQPDAYNALLFMATLQSGQEAIQNYEKALSIDPNNFLALFNIASAFIELKQYNKALPYAEHAVQIAPESEQAITLLEEVKSEL